jgi:hypothetical protein
MHLLVLVCVKLTHQKFTVSWCFSLALASKKEDVRNKPLVREASCMVFFEVKQLTIVNHTLTHEYGKLIQKNIGHQACYVTDIEKVNLDGLDSLILVERLSERLRTLMVVNKKESLVIIGIRIEVNFENRRKSRFRIDPKPLYQRD